MITSLTLTNFRNHTATRIATGGRGNIIITGPNGSGKTAILEAISMLSGDRGLRGAAMVDIARFNGGGDFAAFADLIDDTSVSISFGAGDTNRRAQIDGDAAPLADLGSHLRVVWLTPREDRLFVDAVGDRRAFFDRLAAGFNPSHSGRVARLSKLLSERTFALKSHADANWLDALDLQIAGIAVAVAAARIQYAGELNYFLTDAAVSVSGMIESLLLSNTATDAEEYYLKYLKQNRELAGDKMIIDGPHKSDFGVFNRALKLPVGITSTGQQKRILADLILAHAKLIKTKTGKQPIILLDEAAAHLDENARQRLFLELAECDAQVWATGVDASVFENVNNAAFVTCKDGDIVSIL